jgi:putative glutamine amidotransferase
MVEKPLIGIPCFQDTFPPQQRPRFVTYHGYVKALEAAGAVPVLLPLPTGEALETARNRLDAIMLVGGDDINPAWYGQERYPKSEPPDDLRDEVEITLARRAVETHQPLLAICRGMQVLNVAFGGTLIQHIADLVPGAIQHEFNYDDYHQRQEITHTVEIVPDSRLASILGTQAGVNSFHHQAVAKVADVFRPVACAPDGIVEGIEGRNAHFVLGIQWHPEDMFHANAQMLSLFRAFVDFVRRGKQG